MLKDIKEKAKSEKGIIGIGWQFFKFGIVGFSNTAISLIIYYIFVYFDEGLYMVGNTVGFIVSVLNGYYWNNKFVFRDENRNHFKAIIKIFISYGFTFILSSALLFVMINYLNVSEYKAPIINLFITIPLNFILNKFWSYK